MRTTRRTSRALKTLFRYRPRTESRKKQIGLKRSLTSPRPERDHTCKFGEMGVIQFLISLLLLLICNLFRNVGNSLSDYKASLSSRRYTLLNISYNSPRSWQEKNEVGEQCLYNGGKFVKTIAIKLLLLLYEAVYVQNFIVVGLYIRRNRYSKPQGS